MDHPRSGFAAPPLGGNASGPAKPDPRRPLGRTWCAAILALVCVGTSAQTVTLNGQLGNQQALLVIDGQPRAVAVGATVQGVRLLSLTPGRAEVDVSGVRRTLAIGAGAVKLQGEAPSSAQMGPSRVATPTTAMRAMISMASVMGDLLSSVLSQSSRKCGCAGCR